ncbi:MAG: DUF6399 domain-containing protein, partial [Thermodesulfobacteriota bacterium]
MSDDKRQLMHTHLIPGFYLRRVADREKDPDIKEVVRQKSEELLRVLHNINGPLCGCTASEIDRMERTAKQCAGFLQRSSSCVEGRNA